VIVSLKPINGFVVITERRVIFFETEANIFIDFRYEKASVGSKKVQ
jgi:hypothetical protein